MFGLFGTRTPGVSATMVEAQIQEGSTPFLLDVREPHEYAAGHIAGSCLIPLGTLGDRHHELPKEQEIVVICRSGSRSAMATRMLIEAGYRATNMVGGMLAWRGPIHR